MDNVEGTHLCDKPISSMGIAHREIGRKCPDGIHAEATPVVLIPKRLPFSIAIGVPEGFYALLYKHGRYITTLQSGLKLAPPWYKVQYLVSKQYTVFDTPVKGCPTIDNVHIQIDTLIVFRIMNKKIRVGEDMEDDAAKVFVTTLGPRNLDEFMRNEIEEAVRALGRSVEVNNALDLSAASTDDLKRTMNERFNRYGVEITNVTVTDVKIPDSFAKINAELTTYGTREKHRIDNHNFEMLKARMKQQVETYGKQLVAQRIAAEQEAVIIQVAADREIGLVKAKREAMLSEINLKLKKEKAQILGTVQKEVALIKSEQNKLVGQIDAKTASSVAELRAEAELYSKEKMADSNLIVAAYKSKALKLEAEAEEKMQSMLSAKRKYEIDVKKLDILTSLVGNKNLLIAGPNGQLSRLDIPFMPEITGIAMERAAIEEAFKRIDKGDKSLLSEKLVLDKMIGIASKRKI